MYIGKKIYLCYYKLDIYRSEKIDFNLIKNYKNYNFKSRKGKRYNLFFLLFFYNIQNI